MLPLLRSHLRQANSTDDAPHCDAETLTAFAERTLDPTERDRVAHHLSECPYCCEVLATSSQAAVPPASEKTQTARTRLRWFYGAAALASLCVAAIVFHHPSKTPPSPPQPPQHVASTNPPPVPKFTGPPIFSPRLTDAQVTSPVLTGFAPVWRINSSRYPAALEISYNNGQTWSLIRTPGFQPKSVASEGTTVWVADAKGTVLQSTDVGLHWTRLPQTTHPSPVR